MTYSKYSHSKYSHSKHSHSKYSHSKHSHSEYSHSKYSLESLGDGLCGEQGGSDCGQPNKVGRTGLASARPQSGWAGKCWPATSEVLFT